MRVIWEGLTKRYQCALMQHRIHQCKSFVTSESLKNIDQLSEKEFDVARKYATECIADNKRKLKEYIAAEKAIIK